MPLAFSVLHFCVRGYAEGVPQHHSPNTLHSYYYYYNVFINISYGCEASSTFDIRYCISNTPCRQRMMAKTDLLTLGLRLGLGLGLAIGEAYKTCAVNDGQHGVLNISFGRQWQSTWCLKYRISNVQLASQAYISSICHECYNLL